MCRICISKQKYCKGEQFAISQTPLISLPLTSIFVLITKSPQNCKHIYSLICIRKVIFGGEATLPKGLALSNLTGRRLLGIVPSDGVKCSTSFSSTDSGTELIMLIQRGKNAWWEHHCYWNGTQKKNCSSKPLLCLAGYFVTFTGDNGWK